MKKTLGIFAVGLSMAFTGFAHADNHSNDWFTKGDGKYDYVKYDNHDKGNKGDQGPVIPNFPGLPPIGNQGDQGDHGHCCPPPPCCHNPGASVPLPSSAYTGGLGVIAIGIGSLVRARRAVKA